MVMVTKMEAVLARLLRRVELIAKARSTQALAITITDGESYFQTWYRQTWG